MKIGIMGGTFDPVHMGHLIVAEEVRVRLSLDRILFIPTGDPWLKEGLEISPSHHRMAMVELAAASNPFFKTSPMELERPGPSYTVDTLEELRNGLPAEAELYFILGGDSIKELYRWHSPEKLFDLCTLVAVSRPGSIQFDPTSLESIASGASRKVMPIEDLLIDISGTEIRRRVAEGVSIRYWVPPQVEEYIQEHGLYHKGAPAVEGYAQRVLRLAEEKGALQFGEFTFTSGIKGSYYFDGRLISLDPEGAYYIAKALLPMLRECGAQAIGGPTLGADPLISSVVVISHLEGYPISGFIVRNESKGHGTQKQIEGPLVPGSRVAIIDDTCTTGGSIFRAIRAAEAEGCQVVKVLCVLDRHQGGSDQIKREGYDFFALLEANEKGEVRPSAG